jgi:hypothetical protein
MNHIYPGEVMMEALRQEHQRRVEKAIRRAQISQEARRRRHMEEAGQSILATVIRKFLYPYRLHTAR